MVKISNAVYGIVVLVVVVLLISTVAIPVVESAQNTVTTKEQNTSQRFFAVESDNLTTEISIVDSVLTIGGKQYTISSNSNSAILVADNFALLGVVYQGTTSYSLFDGENNLSVSNVTNIALSIDSGVVSYTYSEADYETTLGNNVLIISDKGNYGQFAGNTADIHVNKDAKVYMSLQNALWTGSSTRITSLVSGTLDSLSASLIAQTTPTFTDISETATITVTGLTESEDGYTYLLDHTLTSVSISAKISDTTVTTTINNAWNATIFAPIEYTVVDDSNPLFMLLGIIPLVMMIVPIMIAVGMVSSGRD